MHRLSIYVGLLFSAAVLLAACGSNEAVPTASFPTAVPATATSPAPTSGGTVAPGPTAASAPTTSASAESNSSNDSSSSDTVHIVVVPDKSTVNYRVREQLASLSFPSDAIGKTSAITGTIVGKTDGSIVSSESKFTVDLRTLQSDRSQRDNFLRRSVLQTQQYPYATFVPTAATGFPLPPPTTGQAAFKLTGNLTIRDVTKPVTWDVTCTGQGTQGTCQGSTTFTFEYFNLEQPRVSVVLSVEDQITLELDLTLQRVGS